MKLPSQPLVWWWLSERFFAREGLQVEATVFNSISKITEGLKMDGRVVTNTVYEGGTNGSRLLVPIIPS